MSYITINFHILHHLNNANADGWGSNPLLGGMTTCGHITWDDCKAALHSKKLNYKTPWGWGSSVVNSNSLTNKAFLPTQLAFLLFLRTEKHI